MVTNTGGSEGGYTVVLKINGVLEAREEVTLKAGESETVSFTTKKDAEGIYTVDIDGKIGKFTVTAPPPVEPVVPPPAKPINWPLILGIVGGVIVLGLILWLVVFRRRVRQA